MHDVLIRFREVLLKYYLDKLRHNGISCHPTSTLLKKPCDSQRLPEVII
jgi:hypothetical protein